MKIFFAMLIIILLAFSGYHLTFRSFRLPLFARKLYFTGTEFLFLGLLMGPQFLNLLDDQTRQGLEPLGALLLGWIGLLFGFQFEIVKLRRFPFEFIVAVVLAGLIPFAVVFLSVFGTLMFFPGIANSANVVVSLTLASAAACTAQTGLALQAPKHVARRPELIKLLRFISSFDGLSAMLIFGLVFIFRPAIYTETAWLGVFSSKVLISLGTSAGLLFLYTLFLTRRQEESELVLVVIGMVVLTCGTASMLRFSPLLTNFVIGVCIVNTSREKERIFNILISIEKPVYLLLLVFIGTGWRMDSVWLLALAAVYCLYRFLGKMLGGIVINRFYPGSAIFPPQLGFGLLAQGGLPLAILLEFQQEFPFDFTPAVICIGLLAVIYNDILSSYLLKHLLSKEHS